MAGMVSPHTDDTQLSLPVHANGFEARPGPPTLQSAHDSATSPSSTNDAPEDPRNLDNASPQPVVQTRGGRISGCPIPRSNATGSYAPASFPSPMRDARIAQQSSSATSVEYDTPDSFANLDELAVLPVENPSESSVYEHRSLEQTRTQERAFSQEGQSQGPPSATLGQRAPTAPLGLRDVEKSRAVVGQESIHISRLATQIYTLSYLVFFAIFGTLARLGLQALTEYPGTPVSFVSIWPNFGGSLVMGFLAEDRMLFRSGWGTPTYDNLLREPRKTRHRNGAASASDVSAVGGSIDLAAAKRAHLSTKKTIPLYIGLATGFCGSFTSFSSFVRDIFLALSNDMASVNTPRNGGYSFMAVLAVIILTVSLSLGGLFVGAHIAIAVEPFTPSLPFHFTRRILDRVFVLLGWGCWLGAILLSALPPDRGGISPETWRGRATFALVFAPIGCLGRFYASLYLNRRIAAFPLGTFAVNMVGTLVLGVSWDLAHVPFGGVVGCQVLQGVEDGFCGCLTTVSTWVAELSGLRRRNAYVYGTTSVLAGLAILVAVMGGLKWSDGFSAVQCVH